MRLSHGFIWVMALVGLLAMGTAVSSRAEVVQSSRFHEATVPLSVLDQRLAEVTRTWNETYVGDPEPTTLQAFPLLCRAEVQVQLSFDSERDVVSAICSITDLLSFDDMTEGERETLLVQLLDALRLHVAPLWLLTDREYEYQVVRVPADCFQISLGLSGRAQYEGHDRLDESLPLTGVASVGQAGYSNGRFAYSTSSYLRVGFDGSRWVVPDQPARYVVREQ